MKEKIILNPYPISMTHEKRIYESIKSLFELIDKNKFCYISRHDFHYILHLNKNLNYEIYQPYLNILQFYAKIVDGFKLVKDIKNNDYFGKIKNTEIHVNKFIKPNHIILLNEKYSKSLKNVKQIQFWKEAI